MVHHHLSVVEQIQYFESISYLGIFLAVALSGHIVPFPEDVILPLIGYIAATHVVRLRFAILVSIVAIIFADYCLYYLSYTGKKIALLLEKKVKTNIFNRYIDIMNKRTFVVMFFSRFVPGLRVLNPLVAGFIKVNQAKFFIYSVISACVYVPLMILIGFYFHSKIIPLITAVESTRRFIFIGLILVVGIVVTIWVNKKFFGNKQL